MKMSKKIFFVASVVLLVAVITFLLIPSFPEPIDMILAVVFGILALCLLVMPISNTEIYSPVERKFEKNLMRYWFLLTLLVLLVGFCVDWAIREYFLRDNFNLISLLNACFMTYIVFYGIWLTVKKYREFKRNIIRLAKILILWIISVYMFVPYLHRIPQRSRMIACRSNMSHIYNSLRRYAEDYGGDLPPSLEVLKKTNYLHNKNAYLCPANKGYKIPYVGEGNDDGPFITDYIYYPTHKLNPNEKALVLEDKIGNHKREYRNKLYSDGTVKNDFFK